MVCTKESEVSLLNVGSRDGVGCEWVKPHWLGGRHSDYAHLHVCIECGKLKWWNKEETKKDIEAIEKWYEEMDQELEEEEEEEEEDEEI